MEKSSITEERILKPLGGIPMLLLSLFLLIGSTAFFVVGIIFSTAGPDRNEVVHPVLLGISITVFVVGLVAGLLLLCGLKVIHPNEALVLTLFGKYYGTLYHAGFYWVVPFCSAVNPAAERTPVAAGKDMPAVSGAKKSVSLKTLTLNNQKQKVNDAQGNPVEIGTVVIWHVANATKAVLNVENFARYLSIQCDAITRNAARRYPYDTAESAEDKSLRGSRQELAGIVIEDVRITHLAYAPEIASAMLQRQQAAAIIDARQKIVEGAVGMVQMALQQLSENEIVELDEERKAAMVSNLLVVLCGNKDAQPIVNSGSLY